MKPSARPSSLLLGVAALVLVLLAWCGNRAGAAPEDAVVRIPSHGCSGTVIQTGAGRSLVLTCAHAFQGADRAKALTLDVPTDRPQGSTRPAAMRVLAVDYDLDLTLIELETGPLPFVAPVAPAAHRLSAALVSAGYDEMRLPATVRRATPVAVAPTVLFTRERPWHGRSGGGLLDGPYLVGTVIGYETGGERRGIYTSHAAVRRFLARALPGGSEPGPRLEAMPLPSRPWLRPAEPCPGGS
jgi:hypothetical protein